MPKTELQAAVRLEGWTMGNTPGELHELFGILRLTIIQPLKATDYKQGWE